MTEQRVVASKPKIGARPSAPTVAPEAVDGDGKKGKKGVKGSRKLQPGERCQSDSQCTSGYICEVPVNGSNSDEYCSGGQGAVCGAPNEDGDDTFPFCAVGFACTPSGNRYTCQAVADEI